MFSFDQNFFMLLFPLFFLMIFLFCFGVVKYLNHRKRQQAGIKKIKHGGFDKKKSSNDETDVTLKPQKNLAVSFFSLFSGGSKKKSFEREIKSIKFLKAGIQYENIESAFFGAKLVLPIFFIIIFIFLRIFLFKVMTDPVAITALVSIGLAGFYLPEIWLQQKTEKRKERMFKGLPDALDLLIVCVEAGMGLDSAINRIAQELKSSYPDLSQEFSRMNLEMRAGKPRQDALRNMSLRTGIAEMNSLVTLLIQTDKFGTSVAKALTVFSESFRTKRFQMAEEIAAKLPVKILLPLILFIFPALFVAILGPAAITIYRNLLAPG